MNVHFKNPSKILEKYYLTVCIECKIGLIKAKIVKLLGNKSHMLYAVKKQRIEQFYWQEIFLMPKSFYFTCFRNNFTYKCIAMVI